VIQITQAMLDDQPAEDVATREMMPYRPQTPCDADSKSVSTESRGLSV